MTPLNELKATRSQRRKDAARMRLAVTCEEQRCAKAAAKIQDGERALEATRDRLAYEATATLLASFRIDHTLATKRLGDAQVAHADAAQALRTAEAAVVAVVDTMLRKEDVDDAQEIEMALNRIQQLGIALLHKATANELNGHHPPDEVRGVLTRLDLPLIDRRDIAINLIRVGDTAAAQEREARRAAMIADDPTPEHAAA